MVFVKQQWARALAGLTDRDIAFGAQKLSVITTKYFPTAGDFRKMCIATPEDMGIPTTTDAYIECQRAATYKVLTDFKFTHPIVWYAGRHFGWENLKHIPNREIFVDIYTILKARYLASESLEAIIPKKLGYESVVIPTMTRQEKNRKKKARSKLTKSMSDRLKAPGLYNKRIDGPGGENTAANNTGDCK